MNNNIAILIPAYNPTEILEELVEKLRKNGYTKIIIVDDGSKEKEIFKKIKKNAVIITHNENLGKGRALKTGFEYCLDNMHNLVGIITVDADGQHLVKDIKKVYKKILGNPESLILGSRDFTKENIPLRSFMGNRIMSYIFKKKTKVGIKDTQTGLRAIPIKYIVDFNKIDGDRFEYETNMLLYAINKNIEIIEEQIESVYVNKNKTSHFKVVEDSMKIIKMALQNSKI